MLDPAVMAVHLGHLTGEAQMRRAFETLYTVNHLPFGAPPRLAEGAEATLLWFDAPDPVEVLRRRPLPEVYWRGRALSGRGQ